MTTTTLISGQTLTNATILSGNSDLETDGSTIHVAGTLDDLGVVSLTATYDQTSLILDSATVSVASGGVLSLNNDANNLVEGSSGTRDALTNLGIIEGGGQIGSGTAASLTLTNQAGGVIDGNQSSAGLVINTGTVAVINNGLIEATGAAGLTIENNLTNSGRILAEGTLTITGNVSGSGSFTIGNDGVLELGGTSAESAVFRGTTSGTQLVLEEPTKYTGKLGSLAAGDTIDLIGVTASSAQISSGHLNVSLKAGGIISYTLANPHSGIQAGVSLNNSGTDIFISSISNKVLAVPVMPNPGRMGMAFAVPEAVKTPPATSHVSLTGAQAFSDLANPQDVWSTAGLADYQSRCGKFPHELIAQPPTAAAACAFAVSVDDHLAGRPSLVSMPAHDPTLKHL